MCPNGLPYLTEIWHQDFLGDRETFVNKKNPSFWEMYQAPLSADTSMWIVLGLYD